MDRLKTAIDTLVYASVVLGLLFLLAASGLVPSWLLYSLVGGEVAYAATALAVARGYRGAYYVVIALALLVLLVSLPRPEHYAFATNGQLGDFAIFAAGSVFQLCLLVMVPIYMKRKPSP